MIIYASDFDLSGSGYMNLSVALCNELTRRGYEVMALGMGYDRREHHNSFTIVPTTANRIAPMVGTLAAGGHPVEAVIVAFDIPFQIQLLKQFKAPNPQFPYIALFPIESGPTISPKWALSLLQAQARLVMSHVAVDTLKGRGVESEFIPLALDFEAWRPPTPDERAQIRHGLGMEEGTFNVLTVADNQERKNLSKTLEIFAGFAEKRPDATYTIVTRTNSNIGYDIEGLAMDLGIMPKVQIYQRGMPRKNLWSLYAAADCMLLTSKAEGLAMPVLEAMACRLPVVGTGGETAIKEHLQDGRGLLINTEYTMIDPFGNGTRYMADTQDGVYKLQLLATGMTPADRSRMLDRAEAYVRERTWEKAGAVMAAAIERVKVRTEAETMPELAEAA